MVKNRPFFTQKDLIYECVRNATMKKSGSNSFYIGPHHTNSQMYAEYFKYFCAILQKALLNGNKVKLPGIGSIWLQVTEPSIHPHSFKGKPKLFLKAVTAKKLENMVNIYAGEANED